MHVPVFQILYTHRTSLRFEKCAGMLVFQGLNDATTLRSKKMSTTCSRFQILRFGGDIYLCALCAKARNILLILYAFYTDSVLRRASLPRCKNIQDNSPLFSKVWFKGKVNQKTMIRNNEKKNPILVRLSFS